MPDYGDRSQAAGDMLLKASFSNIQQHTAGDVEYIYCTECGCEIPKERRRVMPGCRLCVECQQLCERQL